MIYPGKILYDTEVIGTLANGKAWVLKNSEVPGENIRLIIKEKYLPIRCFLYQGITLDKVIVLRQEPDKGWIVAQANYDTELCNQIYPNGLRDRIKPDHPWTTLWASKIINPSCKETPPLKRLKCGPGFSGWESWTVNVSDEALVPVPGRWTHKIEEKDSRLFPACLSDSTPLKLSCVFTRDEQNFGIWPRWYDVTMDLQSRHEPDPMKIRMTVLIYPTANPMKLHRSIRKHLFGHGSEARPDEDVYWKTWTGWGVSENPDEIFKECANKCDKCGSDTEHFFRVQQNIREYSKKYLEQAVTFWERCTTIKSRVTVQKDRNSDDVWRFQITCNEYEGENKDLFACLVLRGWCYESVCNKDAGSTVHLNIVTCYAGENDPAKKPDNEDGEPKRISNSIHYQGVVTDVRRIYPL